MQKTHLAPQTPKSVRGCAPRTLFGVCGARWLFGVAGVAFDRDIYCNGQVSASDESHAETTIWGKFCDESPPARDASQARLGQRLNLPAADSSHARAGMGDASQATRGKRRACEASRHARVRRVGHRGRARSGIPRQYERSQTKATLRTGARGSERPRRSGPDVSQWSARECGESD